VKWLTTLPGIGSASAEQIVATLRRKVTRFALMPTPRDDRTVPEAPESATPMDVMAEAYNALLQLGHSPADARDMLDRVASSGRRLSSVEEVLMQIYQRK
jgi:Holliday junction DNA helicase RuvA